MPGSAEPAGVKKRPRKFDSDSSDEADDSDGDVQEVDASQVLPNMSAYKKSICRGRWIEVYAVIQQRPIWMHSEVPFASVMPVAGPQPRCAQEDGQGHAQEDHH